MMEVVGFETRTYPEVIVAMLEEGPDSTRLLTLAEMAIEITILLEAEVDAVLAAFDKAWEQFPNWAEDLHDQVKEALLAQKAAAAAKKAAMAVAEPAAQASQPSSGGFDTLDLH